MPFETVIYKTVGTVALEARIFRPEAHRVPGYGGELLPPGQRPAVLLFSCGGWQTFGLDKVTPEALYLAARGAVCFAIQVRVLNKHGTPPADCLIDGKSAVRWVRSQAARFGIDPQKIVVTGDSASGHVSASLCVIEDFDDPADDRTVSARPNTAVIICPALVIHHPQGRVTKFGGPERARALSPILHVRADAPPMLIVAGGADDVTYPEEAWLFKRVMDRVGARCELHIIPGQGHGMQLYLDGKNPIFYQTYGLADRFLESLGFLQSASAIEQFPFAAQLAATKAQAQA